MIVVRDVPTYTGVYAIGCTKTDDLYIGSSVNIQMRIATHLAAIRRGRHFQTAPTLVRLAKRIGIDSLTCRVLCRCDRGEERIRELELIGELKPSLNSHPDNDHRNIAFTVTRADFLALKWLELRSGESPQSLARRLVMAHLNRRRRWCR